MAIHKDVQDVMDKAKEIVETHGNPVSDEYALLMAQCLIAEQLAGVNYYLRHIAEAIGVAHPPKGL